MVDWNAILNELLLYWEEFASWFLNIPIYGQVLVIFGAVAMLILAGVLVYYILKGVAYLIYYLLKGVYLLLKGIILGIYKLFRNLYFAISGKPKPPKDEEALSSEVERSPQIEHNKPEMQLINPNAIYCSECGNKFSEKMLNQLSENGMVYCVNCGMGYKSNLIVVDNY
ncbi:MAG: zinc ribbon domain-containing protein [Promethearchaeota archaeon]|nr:MAG: zinc ribbon domain-containing protein [Candidatus Lokiarchaeota archaeon]